MSNLILKDEEIMSSPSIVGYKVLAFMADKKVSKISLFDVADHFKTEKWFSPKSLYFAMLFLFAVDIIDFNNSYIIKK
ncbi:hypothetical protein ACTJJB_22630 [Chitinophaga sp. 22536]|uniref:hypothetical protein n=1 Tax=unclassified Chitinophaga TaxID=2619133 RepID=UPI003F835727